MREIRTKTVHLTGTKERVSESQAQVRAESFIESDTTAVHTSMYAGGDFLVTTYRRVVGEHEWTLDSRVRGSASSPTRWMPRSEPSRPPHSVCAADNFYGS